MRNRRSIEFSRSITAAIALGASLVVSIPALADPPSHAPAHGWRKKNDPYYVGYTGRQWERDYGIIGGRCNRDDIGTAVGAVIGGVIGSKVGEGSDRTVAIIVGTVIGAIIGREIGRELDDSDRACVGHALEIGRDGQVVRWLNDRTGVTWIVTPIASKKKDSACRDFRLQATRDGRSQTENARACRTGDGTWTLK